MGLLSRTHTETDEVPYRESQMGTRTTERHRNVAPGQVVSLIAGAVFIVVGVIALVRAGIDGTLDAPVVDVVGYSHTAWLGIAEIAVGVILVLAGTTVAGRSLSVLMGTLLAIAGALVLAIPEDLPEELGVEKDFGWPLLIVGVVVALAALMLPAWQSHTVDRETVDLRGH
jgi:hypothetical protein